MAYTEPNIPGLPVVPAALGSAASTHGIDGAFRSNWEEIDGDAHADRLCTQC